MSDLKAWQINESEIYAGRTLDEAVAAAMELTGNTREETLDETCCEEVPADAKVRLDTEEETYTTVGEILAEMDGPGPVCGDDG